MPLCQKLTQCVYFIVIAQPTDTLKKKFDILYSLLTSFLKPFLLFISFMTFYLILYKQL